MNDTKTGARRIPLLGLALFALGLPACHSAGPWSGDGSASRVAYRPVQTSLRGRPFYVSGYGGADYSPARPRRIGTAETVSGYAMPAPASGPPAVTVLQGTWDEP